ncbi:MAG TPA: hypothetical protein VEQ60_09500 [Longimicrobium sp.]|nr:hypothetical protein [Longimicrobium sp.]
MWRQVKMRGFESTSPEGSMSRPDHPLADPFSPRVSLDRRSFLASSAAGATTLALTPFGSVFGGEAVQGSTALPFVTRFGQAVGASVVADLVSDYVSSRPNTWLARQINRVNDSMYHGGFTDFSRSPVRSTRQGIFYPIVHRDAFNLCLVFHLLQREDPAPPILSSPTVVGLALAAEEIKRSTGSERARQVLYPVRTLSRGTGSFEADYHTPDVHDTAGGGRVTVSYRNIGPGRGTVAVLAEGPVDARDWTTLFHMQYSITYA